MNRIARSIAGETLAETVIALSILAVGITLSSSILSTSLRNMGVARDRATAVHLAREGLEAMRNIRDTNWLKYASRRRICWNHLPQPLDSDDCQGDHPIQPGTYVIYKSRETEESGSVSERWRLASGISPDLSLVDADGDGTRDLFNATAPLDALGRNNPSPTPFRRQLAVSYLANDGTEKTDTGTPATLTPYNRMRVTSTVSWDKDGRTFRVTLSTDLTDYLGRESLDE